VCNPFGGLGLTGGIVDVGGLYDCLVGVYTSQADEDILTLYDEIRREKYNNIINPVSSENIRRLFDQDPDTAMQKDKFLQLVKKAETDVDAQDILNQGAFSIAYDFTQHYHTMKTSAG
jgi:2-polyprenyl-6-methoxyphenol hydroxylase-like FAD-dependent oxidoreductase